MLRKVGGLSLSDTGGRCRVRAGTLNIRGGEEERRAVSLSSASLVPTGNPAPATTDSKARCRGARDGGEGGSAGREAGIIQQRKRHRHATPGPPSPPSMQMGRLRPREAMGLLRASEQARGRAGRRSETTDSMARVCPPQQAACRQGLPILGVHPQV